MFRVQNENSTSTRCKHSTIDRTPIRKMELASRIQMATAVVVVVYVLVAKVVHPFLC
jgi:hypothetical protein